MTHAERKARWAAMDWRLSTSEIAAALNVSKNRVMVQRRKLAPETLMSRSEVAALGGEKSGSLNTPKQIKIRLRNMAAARQKRWEKIPNPTKRKVGEKVAWHLVDWNQSSIEIANQLNVWPTAISAKRRELAPDTLNQRPKMKNKKWDSVDWSQKNLDIARRLGVSRPRVAQMRRKLAPETIRNWQRRAPEEAQQIKNDWARSPKGRAWLATNQKKKNAARDQWRKRKKLKAAKKISDRAAAILS